MARVSVIISTYNRKKLLKRAISSVLAQSMSDFELIIVDDCSTDNTYKDVVAPVLKDKRVRYIKTNENNGHDGPVKNLGITYALGEYIAFLDDDDAYRVDALKILTRYADESKSDVVYGDYLIDGKPGWSVDFSVAQLSQMNYISMCVAMIKSKSLIGVGGFDEDIPKFKDWNLWLRLQKRGAAFLHIPIIVSEVTQQEESISTKFEVERDGAGNYKPTYFNPADCKIFPENTSIGKQKPLRVAIYTLTMNRLEYTKQMYEAMCRTAGYDFDWFVIDQGSTDGTKEWIKGLTRDGNKIPGNEPGTFNIMNMKYRLYQENVGLAKGWNNIVEFIKSEGEYDIVVKVDNDAELMSKGWLASMIDIYERNRKMILSPYVEGLDGSPGGVLRQRAGSESPYLLINDFVLGLVPNLGGIVFATPIEIWESWKFDESFEGNKDLLLSRYASKLGYSLFYMEEFRVWHIDGTRGQHKKYPEYFEGRADFTPDIDKEPTTNEEENSN